MYKICKIKTAITAKRYRANGRPDQDGGLTWHYVLHVILLLAPLLPAEADGAREEHYRAREGNPDGEPREDVRPIVPDGRVVFQHLLFCVSSTILFRLSHMKDMTWSNISTLMVSTLETRDINSVFIINTSIVVLIDV
jgi:hypothetical protein